MIPCDGPFFSLICVTHCCLRQLDLYNLIPTSHFPKNRFSLRAMMGHNQIAQSSSVKPPILLRHLSLTFYWAAHQPQCVETYTCHSTCIRSQTCDLSTREDSNNHMKMPCTFFSESLDTVFCLFIPKDSLLVEGEMSQVLFVSLSRRFCKYHTSNDVFSRCKSVHKMATGKSDDELIQLDNKMTIWTRSGKFRKVENPELSMAW